MESRRRRRRAGPRRGRIRRPAKGHPAPQEPLLRPGRRAGRAVAAANARRSPPSHFAPPARSQFAGTRRGACAGLRRGACGRPTPWTYALQRRRAANRAPPHSALEAQRTPVALPLRLTSASPSAHWQPLRAVGGSYASRSVHGPAGATSLTTRAEATKPPPTSATAMRYVHRGDDHLPRTSRVRPSYRRPSLRLRRRSRCRPYAVKHARSPLSPSSSTRSTEYLHPNQSRVAYLTEGAG